MTALAVAALLLAGAACALGYHWLRQAGRRSLELRVEQLRADRAEQTVDMVRADAEQAGREHEEALADFDARNTRLRAERDEAVRRGQQATTAAMTILAHERAESLSSLQAWQQLFFAALLLPAPQPALPAGRSVPELLPSGHALFDGDPAVLEQLDDVLDGPLPAGTTGTRTATEPRTRKAKP